MLLPERGAPVVGLEQREFLSWPAVVVMDGGAQVTLSVGDLIRYLANNQGAVHASIPREPKGLALQRFNRMRRFGPDWQYSGGVHGSREIARVVLAAVSDLRQRVTAETWPAGYPVELKGLEGQGVVRRADGALVFTDGTVLRPPAPAG